jgi:PII-like signaling protein
MNTKEVIMVRVYLHEASAHLTALIKYLHDEAKVRGVTVFRGVSGFGDSGRLHTSTLMDMSLDLPVVVEFYDDPENAMTIIGELSHRIKSRHIVYWPAKVNF